MIKYAFAIKANDNWYLTLMGCKRGCFTGDITPAYATLDRNRIVEIKELLPDIKIIFIMRNPVDRVWSAVRMEYKRGKIKSISDDEFTREPKSNEYMKRTQYTKTIDDWVSVYGEENVFLCFYEEIIEHPMKLLENITSFLRIGFDEEYFQASAKKRANRGKARELPTRYGNILATMFQDEITELASRYGEYPERWLSDNKKYL